MKFEVPAGHARVAVQVVAGLPVWSDLCSLHQHEWLVWDQKDIQATGTGDGLPAELFTQMKAIWKFHGPSLCDQHVMRAWKTSGKCQKPLEDSRGARSCYERSVPPMTAVLYLPFFLQLEATRFFQATFGRLTSDYPKSGTKIDLWV